MSFLEKVKSTERLIVNETFGGSARASLPVFAMDPVAYRAFDNVEDSPDIQHDPLEREKTPPLAARGRKWVEALPLGLMVAAALNPDGADWERLSNALTYADVKNRLHAAHLSGLTESVWHGLLAMRTLDALPQQVPAVPEIAPSAPIPSVSAPQCAQHHLPSVPRMRGRVPRTEETWQYVEGELAIVGCMRACRLVLWNLSGMFSSKVRAHEALNIRTAM